MTVGAGFSIYARDTGKRAEIFIYEDVGEGWFGGFTAKQFSEELTAIGKSVAEIDLHINSYGGDVFDGLAVYNLLVQHPANITTHIDGVAASIASVIAMAGNTIHMAENAQVMVHNAWGIVAGDAATMRKQADLLDSVTTKIAGVYAARTRLPLDAVLALMAEETWLTSDQALDKGFADSVTDNLRVAAFAAPSSVYNFKRLPAFSSVQRPSPIELSEEEKQLRDTVRQQQAKMRRNALTAPRVPQNRNAGPQPAATTAPSTGATTPRRSVA